MFKLRFTVTYVDGQKVEVTSRLATEIAFERRFGRTVGSLFAGMAVHEESTDEEKRQAAIGLLGELHQDYLTFLAWHSARATDQYDDWVEKVEDVEWNFAVEPVDPTNPVPSAGS